MSAENYHPGTRAQAIVALASMLEREGFGEWIGRITVVRRLQIDGVWHWHVKAPA